MFKELHQNGKRLRQYLKHKEKGEYIDEDMKFHASIARATGNAKLCDVLENLQNQIWLFRRKTYDISSSTAADYHEKILESLEAGDRERAEKTMREHISQVRNKLIDFLETQQEESSATEAAAVSSESTRPSVPRIAQRA